MPERPWDNPPACSNCGSTRVAWVIHGMPLPPDSLDPEMRRLMDEGRLRWGGCCGGDFWICHDCAERELARGDGRGGGFAGGFDPNESDAAREARRRAEHEAHRLEHERKTAHRATPLGAWEHLRRIILDAQTDIQKARHGNKAAGVRARRAMREAWDAAQGVREAVLGAVDHLRSTEVRNKEGTHSDEL